jgi:hypothetical protein
MSYWMRGQRRALRGFGQDNVACGPGEEFDLTAMMCVQAGQATTPIPAPGPLPSVPASVPVAPPMPPPTAAPVQAPMPSPMGSGLTGALPWVLGGAAVLLVIVVASGAK